MHIGIVLNLTDQTPSIRACAPVLEERGFESLWLGEHTHMPTDSVFRYSSGKWSTGNKAKDGYLPEFYKRMPDPYVQLAAAAMLTSTIKLGTCIALPAEHNPIVLAKEIATLDSLADGRFLFGVGYGWNPLEMAHNGFAYEDRRAVLREKVGAMRALWTEPTASYQGDFVQFSESWSWPKPVGAAGPPVLLGAAPTARNLDDVVKWADGWIPVRAFMGDRMAENLADLRARATEAGRDPASIAISVVDPEGAQGAKRSREVFEARMITEEALDTYEELGVERVILGLPTTDFDFFRWAADKVAQLNERISS